MVERRGEVGSTEEVLGCGVPDGAPAVIVGQGVLLGEVQARCAVEVFGLLDPFAEGLLSAENVREFSTIERDPCDFGMCLRHELDAKGGVGKCKRSYVGISGSTAER